MLTARELMLQVGLSECCDHFHLGDCPEERDFGTSRAIEGHTNHHHCGGKLPGVGFGQQPAPQADQSARVRVRVCTAASGVFFVEFFCILTDCRWLSKL
jgi:hypothetical protein